MSGTFTRETHYRVYDDTAGICLNVGPDVDAGGYVELRTPDKKSEEHFGAIRLVLPPPMARLIGEALMKAADDAEKETP